MRTLSTLAALIALLSLAHVGAPAFGQTQTSVSLQQALQQGMVDVQVYSLGGATGSTVRVDVRRKAGQTVHVEVNPGTVFLSQTGLVQNMAGGTIMGEFIGNTNTYRPGSVIVLADNAWHSYLIESFCMDFHKGPPRSGDRFNLAIQDQRTARILQAPKEPGSSMWAFQFALWMDRDGVSETQLRSRYGSLVTDVDVRVARNILRHAEQAGVAGIPNTVPADVRKETERLFSADGAVRAQALQSLAKMGPRAASVATIVSANVVSKTPGQVTPATWLNITSNPQQTAVLLEQIGLPDLEALRQKIQERRQQREQEKSENPASERRRPLRDLLRRT